MQERSRSPAPVPTPERPTEGDERTGPGLRVVPDALARMRASQVRCPQCDKLIALQLHGALTLDCPRCKRRVTITR